MFERKNENKVKKQFENVFLKPRGEFRFACPFLYLLLNM